ncbi:retinal pigment epithelial membrane protein [Microlunatus endophyticus]|uniref:Dioxygenase n=1 Tax=Microlunatus endophyticus TaxID=1716077 RepID=A0A917S080_9ACTN|nr:carotenoid oxygenase family protein [Microlunatus endophyticus]GGL48450.1 retinal pigment epithelial membrane protein [Microlunatus endophyticus]
MSFYLDGVFAPVPDEIDAYDLEVAGTLPPELDGRYIRNGPNPKLGAQASTGKGRHWFGGAGMLHGVRLSGGRAEWYRNRWIDTSVPDGEPVTDVDGRDLRRTVANTHLIEHGGSLLALCEAGLPYEVSGDLETKGAYDFGGRLRTAMTAHPKTDPMTGELFFFGISMAPPYLTFHVADARGNLTNSMPVDVPAPTMMHDFAITEHYVIWMDLPVVFDRALLGRSIPFSWNEQYGARLGLMARTGGPVQWIEIDPCYVFHVGNAREDGHGKVQLDAIRYSPGEFGRFWQADSLPAASMLYRWSIDPARGAITEQQLDDRNVEFPSLNDHHVGRANRYLYAVEATGNGGVIKYDSESGTAVSHRLPTAHHVGEAVFVPAADRIGATGAAEDAGWLITIVTPQDGGASSLVVLDATDPAAGPTATVRLPRRVPAGFHGSWIPEPQR